ncbi:MAG: TRAM domain-containing protein, partial [Bacteroidetes bacterium]|nr:TRAM domain-containing protein [Bacteroidota bacterium]
EHLDTLSLMDQVKYDFSYTFFYSERPGTLAEKKLEDDIPQETKKRRLNEIIQKQQKHSLQRNQMDLGQVKKVLIEGYSKRSNDQLMGRTDANKVVVFPKQNYERGQYVNLLIKDCTAATLFGEVIDN